MIGQRIAEELVFRPNRIIHEVCRRDGGRSHDPLHHLFESEH